VKHLKTSVNLADAYRVLATHAKHVPDIRAWKLGGTNNSIESSRESSAVTIGYIRECSVSKFESLKPCLLGDQLMEFEFVVRLNETLIESCRGLSTYRDDLDYYLGIECPQFDVSLEALNGAAGTVLKNCSAGELYVSEFPISTANILDYLKVSKDVNFIGLRSDPFSILVEFLEISNLYNLPVKNGHFVALGGLTEIQKASSVKALLSKERFGAL
jgi:hypothetical protein